MKRRIAQAIKTSLFFILLGASHSALGSNLEASFYILDADNQPVKDAVITLTNQNNAPPPSDKKAYELGQRNKQFTPFVLPVQKGAPVTFPNYDDIQHHVYSFSGIKKFEFKLSKETKKNPISFDKAGIVPVGCNIHDWMLAYIVVVDTPFVATTTGDGKANISLSQPGDYQISVWHPRLPEGTKNPIKNNLTSISVEKSFNQTIELAHPLSSSSEANDDIDEFEEY